MIDYKRLGARQAREAFLLSSRLAMKRRLHSPCHKSCGFSATERCIARYLDAEDGPLLHLSSSPSYLYSLLPSSPCTLTEFTSATACLLFKMTMRIRTVRQQSSSLIRWGPFCDTPSRCRLSLTEGSAFLETCSMASSPPCARYQQQSVLCTLHLKHPPSS